MKHLIIFFLGFITITSFAQTKKIQPIIDMHMHAFSADFEGPPPVGMCAPFEHWHVRDAKESGMDYMINVVSSFSAQCTLKHANKNWSPQTSPGVYFAVLAYGQVKIMINFKLFFTILVAFDECCS